MATGAMAEREAVANAGHPKVTKRSRLAVIFRESSAGSEEPCVTSLPRGARIQRGLAGIL